MIREEVGSQPQVIGIKDLLSYRVVFTIVFNHLEFLDSKEYNSSKTKIIWNPEKGKNRLGVTLVLAPTIAFSWFLILIHYGI